MSGRILRGMAAGLVATLALSLMMLTKGLIPRLETVIVLDHISRHFFGSMHLPVPFAGWMWHFLIGTVWWGAWFAIIEPVIPGRRIWLRGLYFGLVVGAIVTWAIAPLAGAGAFDTRFTVVQPLVTLLQHMVYGVVLGLVFGRMIADSDKHPSQGER